MSDGSGVQASVMANVVQAGRAWRKLAQAALAAHGISQARASALVWVHRLGGGVRQITLASYVGIEGTSLVRLLDELSAAGLLVRKDDPVDRRAKTIWLTAHGEELASRIEIVLKALQERVLKGVPQHDIAAVLRLCRTVDDAAQASSAGGRAAAEKFLVKDVALDLSE